MGAGYLVADPDADVMLSLGDEDLDVREVGAGAALLVLLDDSAHAVLE